MKAVSIGSYVKGPQELKVSEVATPSDKSKCLIKVEACALNFFDILQAQGKYQTQPPLPHTLGVEFAGTVIEAPEDSPYEVGSRVFGGEQGAFAEQIACPGDRLLQIPDGWSFKDAAGMFITAPTSYVALVQHANVQEGEWVLVHAAAGGVGLMAVQIAKALGATVVATAGSQHKLDIAKSFGADHLVNYNDADWPKKIKDLTPKKKGVDVVYDPVGLIEKSISCLKWSGRLLIIGFAAGKIENVKINRVLLKNAHLMGVFWGSYASQGDFGTIVEVWQGLYKMIEEKKLRPTIYNDQEFKGLESVGKGLEALGSRGSWGKIIINVNDGDSKQSKL